MCGIFGGIGSPSENIIRALAVANRERGKESLGFFNSNGQIAKGAGDPIDLLSGCAEYLGTPNQWFIAGHTRLATYGSVSNKNAHPFQYGNIIGSHNGCVNVPTGSKYEVDSEILFDRLNQYGDYQEALGDISGYWGLAWTDGSAFMLQAHNNTLAVGRVANVWYYSSDVRHLRACVSGIVDVVKLKNGDTLRFYSDGRMDALPPLVNNTGFGRVYAPIRWWGKGEEGYDMSYHPPKKSKKARKKERKEKFDMNIADGLACEAGYPDFDGFLQAEGIENPSDGLRMLEDCSHNIYL